MAILSNTELAELLEWTAGRVRAGDSFEGRIQYTFAEGPDSNRVSAAVRFDNLNGQGCMRLIEDEELDGSDPEMIQFSVTRSEFSHLVACVRRDAATGPLSTEADTMALVEKLKAMSGDMDPAP